MESEQRLIPVLLTLRPTPQPDGSMRIDFVLKNIGSPPVFSIVIIIEIPEPPRAPESIGGLVLRDSPDVLALQHTLMASLHTPSPHTNIH